jgi:hypothetical protein
VPRTIRAHRRLAALLAWTVLAFGAVVSAPRRAEAQALALGQAAAADPFTWTLGAYFGTSQHAAAGHLWGLTSNREHYFFGLHADVPMVERARWTFSWAPELTPFLLLTKNPEYRLAPSPETGRYVRIQDGRAPVVGFGMAPIGLEWDVRLSPRVETYAAGALGCLWFTRDTPVLFARKFNFTAEFGGGLLLHLDDRHRLRVGYKFHHFSNAHTAPENPGVDAHVVFIGVDRVLTHPRRSRVPHP